MTDEDRKRRPWPDPSKVRRVPIYDGPARTLPQQLAHQRVTEDDEMSDDTAARSRAYHEANDHVDTITPTTEPAQGSRRGTGEEFVDSNGAQRPDAARRDAWREAQVQPGLIPVEERKPREEPYDPGEAA